MADFRANLADREIEIYDFNELEKFILYYLHLVSCPVVLYDENEAEKKSPEIKLDFSTLRDKILIIGWLLAVSNIF